MICVVTFYVCIIYMTQSTVKSFYIFNKIFIVYIPRYQGFFKKVTLPTITYPMFKANLQLEFSLIWTHKVCLDKPWYKKIVQSQSENFIALKSALYDDEAQQVTFPSDLNVPLNKYFYEKAQKVAKSSKNDPGSTLWEIFQKKLCDIRVNVLLH